jgi:hypothetical protein
VNQYIRINDLFPIVDKDVSLFSELTQDNHHGSNLSHHTIKDTRISRTEFTKNMIRLGRMLELKVSSISAFTGKPGTHCLPHIDGDSTANYTWRLAYYVKGEPSTLLWYKNTNRVVTHHFLDTSNKRIVDPHTPSGYSVIDTTEVVHTELLNMSSAFVRTDIPHSLDMSETHTARLTISATFSPHISWEELNYRLDKLNK